MRELPYFQFEPAEYLTKDVSFLPLETQGYFINLCCYYWQRGCSLTEEQIERRLKRKDLLDQLLTEGIIDIENQKITIRFLDKQWISACERSEKAKLNGQRGGRPKSKPKANDNLNESKTKAKRKEEKKKEDIKYEFDHLSMTIEEYDKLLLEFKPSQINQVVENIQNFKNNKKYKSLYLTAKSWLSRDNKEKKSTWV